VVDKPGGAAITPIISAAPSMRHQGKRPSLGGMVDEIVPNSKLEAHVAERA